MDPLRPVRGGDPVRMSAATQNAVLQAARTANRMRGFGAASASEREDAQVLIVAAAALTRFQAFALGAVVNTPVADGSFLRLPVFNSAAVTADQPFGIMLDPAPAGGTGRGLLFGLVPAQVSILSSTHQYVRINSSLALESATTGYARIVWAGGTSGSQWCLLSLPAAGAGPDAGSVTGQILYWDNTAKKWTVSVVGTLATNDLLQWDGTKWVKVTPTQVTFLTAWHLNKTSHAFEVKTQTGYVLNPGTMSGWTAITDADGGLLDEGLTT